ncbi:MAG: hypothetical protein QOF84_5503 [Streptomyces sp.]|nr:hypothetical protein [Streptomyces sp.]
MADLLSAAQRRAILESDAETGRLGARVPTCEALARLGLAVRYGRVGGYYLTPEGLRVRGVLDRIGPEAVTVRREPAEAPTPAPAATTPAPTPAPAATGFTADDGTGPPSPTPPRRAAEVATAWSGLLEIRRVLQDGDTSRPAPWERERLVHSIALALEAAGHPPSTGYSVSPAAAQPGVAEVAWHGTGAPEALAACQQVLERYGWQCTLHRDRHGRSFLLVSPRRA